MEKTYQPMNKLDEVVSDLRPRVELERDCRDELKKDSLYLERPTELSSSPGYTDWAGDVD
jgi:hypothetical protein|tara:strand:- start:659 stop:838 length:180 start_codon:yes stop_codon:yes gene_type:complete